MVSFTTLSKLNSVDSKPFSQTSYVSLLHEIHPYKNKLTKIIIFKVDLLFYLLLIW